MDQEKSPMTSSASKIHPYFKPRAISALASTAGSWTVPDLCAAYDWPTDLAGGGVIAIVELGGGWTESDMTAYFASIHQPQPQIVDVPVDNTKNTPGGAADGEVALDIQVAAAAYYVATGKAASIRIYWASDIAPAVRAAIKDGCDVCSISWGADEADWEAVAARDMEQAAIEAAAAGMVVIAASGDNDSSDGGASPANVDLPAGCPHVLGCGGTLKTRTTEVVWNDEPGNPSGHGTGGGYSSLFPMPEWQLAGGAPRGPGRMVPDVAAAADPSMGYEIYHGGSARVGGGTSAVAPLYAGLLAAAGRKLGFISDKLWQKRGNFVDVTQGDNGMYHAQVGPDPCTGLGVPVGKKLGALLGASSGSAPAPAAVLTAIVARLTDAIAWAKANLPQHGPLSLHMIQHLVEDGLRARWPKGSTAVQLADAVVWAASNLPHATMTRHTACHLIERSLTKHWPKGLP
jgi:kumamolisin